MAINPEYLGSEEGGTNGASREVKVTNGVTVFSRDFVTLASGLASNVNIAKKRILGQVTGGNSRNPLRTRSLTQGTQATGNAAGTVKVIVNIEDDARYLVKANGTLTEAMQGQFFLLLNGVSMLLTSDGTAPANNDTVTVGTVTYTYKTTLTGAANEILIGASASAALDNTKSAVNATAGSGTTYGTGTVANPLASANTKTATTLLLVDNTGTAQALVLTKSSAHLTVSAATGLGGAPGDQRVDVASADNNLGQLVLVQANPAIRGSDATFGIFEIVFDYDDSVTALV